MERLRVSSHDLYPTTRFSRRSFMINCIRAGIAAGIGVVLAEAGIPVQVWMNETVEKSTGFKAQSSVPQEMLERHCRTTANEQACIDNLEYPEDIKFLGTYVGPIIEEVTFRGAPSHLVSRQEASESPMGDVVMGTGGISMTRREILIGALSSILFAGGHNVQSDDAILPKGIDTNILPVTQGVFGFGFWYLQRKLGIFANTSAHIWNNFRTISWRKS